jgi:hypothetical protein
VASVWLLASRGLKREMKSKVGLTVINPSQRTSPHIVPGRLAAAEDPLGVGVGGFVGHALCTLVAVLGGYTLSKYICERYIHVSARRLQRARPLFTYPGLVETCLPCHGCCTADRAAPAVMLFVQALLSVFLAALWRPHLPGLWRALNH